MQLDRLGQDEAVARAARALVHVHVRGQSGEAKFWLEPEVRVADSDGFDAKSACLNWNEHFS